MTQHMIRVVTNMDFSINLGVIMQGFMLAALLHHTKSVRELLATVKLHDWRLVELERRKIPDRRSEE